LDHFFGSGALPRKEIPELGEKVAKRTNPNSEQKKVDHPAHRVIAKNRFAALETIDAVIAKLIGV
jgi:hypothetical protein